MAIAPKKLGGSALSATTLTTIYTVPSATSATVSTIFVCNRSSTDCTFRVSIAVAGAADATHQYLYYDKDLTGNETYAITCGVTLAATDVVRAYASTANVTVNVFGTEIT